MRHKHYDMIMTKAANMELETFIKSDGKWSAMVNAFPISEDFEYFLCLPQHKDACLAWLNGMDVLVQDFPNRHCDSKRILTASSFSGWHDATVFMFDCEISIKPKKEKRWIITMISDNIPTLCGQQLHITEEAAREFAELHGNSEHLQFIEIEVEV